MRALSSTGFFVFVALPLLLVSIVAMLAAFQLVGEEGEPAPAPVTVAPTPAATAAARPTPSSTPLPVAATPTAAPTPARTPTAAPTPAPAPTAPPAQAPANVEGSPYSLADLDDALAPGGIERTELYDPRSACPGTGVEGLPFVLADDEGSGRFAVWVLWVYPDGETRRGDWRTDQRAEPLVAGCEPPNGFIYWNANLLLWFVGFYGEDIAPGSPPESRDEVRGHPVIRAFLNLPS